MLGHGLVGVVWLQTRAATVCPGRRVQLCAPFSVGADVVISNLPTKRRSTLLRVLASLLVLGDDNDIDRRPHSAWRYPRRHGAIMDTIMPISEAPSRRYSLRSALTIISKG